ncbi:hypothetical protein [Candidatus Leptofilum sp.]|uniref:hypothetical protein n=1 Tax=Candidatus Leptofilum sp. TaxID=3241576 RepID=UPI003B5CBA43
MMFLNLVWLLLQLTIVLGPPATAVLYTLSKKMVDEEPWDFQDVWRLLRELFWPAWKWAVPNLVVLLVVVANFYTYQGFQGGGWMALRLFWGAFLISWFILNLFFWPFWLVQENRSLRTTYTNAARLFILHPLTVIVIAILTGIVFTVSASLVFLLAAGVMGWLALAGIIAVQGSLALQQKKSAL